eukprot:4621002-Amphidinium_carterae.1
MSSKPDPKGRSEEFEGWEWGWERGTVTVTQTDVFVLEFKARLSRGQSSVMSSAWAAGLSLARSSKPLKATSVPTSLTSMRMTHRTFFVAYMLDRYLLAWHIFDHFETA